MPISLYDVSVGSSLQTLSALGGVLEKGVAFCREKGIDPETIVETRLFPDMQPFRFQVQSVAFHALRSAEALTSGAFAPPSGPRPPLDYAGLQAMIAEALGQLRAMTPGEIDALEGNDITFTTRDSTRVFTAADFVLTFALPNLHFHAATAYDILRQAGVPVGKRDFLGPLRVKETH